MGRGMWEKLRDIFEKPSGSPFVSSHIPMQHLPNPSSLAKRVIRSLHVAKVAKLFSNLSERAVSALALKKPAHNVGAERERVSV